tara:strand:+ start:2714 stop:4207 length:1494 start_codon:yes stop_codon:yes gene_type:complete
MKLLKKNKITSILIFLMLIISSCSNDFLDVPPEAQKEASSFWQTESDVEQAVNSMYGQLRWAVICGFRDLAVEMAGSDNVAANNAGQGWPDLNAYFNFQVAGTGFIGNEFWLGNYNEINLCNQVLDNIDAVTSLNSSKREQYKAEAKFLRALAHFRLVRAYGNIPLVLNVPSNPEESNPTQVHPNEVYASIEQDLKEAADILPNTSSAAVKGRATRGACLSLLARVALYQSNWTDVLSYTDEVIASGIYSLSDYTTMFHLQGELGSESIFEIQSDYVPSDEQNGIGFSSQWATVQIDWMNFTPSDDLINAYEPGDIRKNATILFPENTYSQTYNGVTYSNGPSDWPAQLSTGLNFNLKAWVPRILAERSSQGSGSEQNVRVIRYADVLLMNAEANNELGNTNVAITNLNVVRERAGLSQTTAVNQSDLREAILRERRVEFALEGLGDTRYFDLIRSGEASSVLGPRGWVPNKNEIWPIPFEQINLSNGVLKQNPGYN